MQRYTIFFIIVTALQLSCGFSAHHQELRNCIHSIWYISNLFAAISSVGAFQGIVRQVDYYLLEWWSNVLYSELNDIKNKWSLVAAAASIRAVLKQQALSETDTFRYGGRSALSKHNAHCLLRTDSATLLIARLRAEQNRT
jgi:hypothetical protein